MFLVVEFSRSKDMVVVPECWTTGQRRSTWWPPYQSTVMLNKAVCSKEVPGEEWSSRSIRTIQVADSYSKARRHLSQAGRQSAGGGGGVVTLRRSERLKRALAQHTEAPHEDTPHPKRRRTCTTRLTSDAPRGDIPVRQPPAPPPKARTRQACPPPPPRRSRRAHLPPPPPPPPPPVRRTRQTHPPTQPQRRRSRRVRLLPPLPPSTARTRQSRPASPSSSPRLSSLLEKIHKSLHLQQRFLNMLLRLLNAMKKYMMLQQMLARLPEFMLGIMERISGMDRVPYLDRIPDIVFSEIIRFVQREAEDEEEEEDEDEEEEEDTGEEDQASITREE